MNSDEIAWLDIEALRAGYSRGELGVAQVIDAVIGRIEALDPRLHAYSVVWPDRARERAEQLDRSRAGREPLAPLFGVPVAVKDLCDVAGEPTRAGTVVLGPEPARAPAEVVRRLESAGAVILGKTTMTEGAFVTHHPSIPPPVNPWSPARWTGISSSGSGVATSAGLCTAALGTDTGGSIRFPSAACGLSGLKPTHGRISLRGVFPLAESLDHIGPMTRSVADTARLFAVLAGPDPDDPWSLVDEPGGSGTEDLVPHVRGVRVGIDRRYCEEGVDAEVGAVLDDALSVLEALGARIVELELPAWSDVVGAWVTIASVEAAIAHSGFYPERADDYGPELRSTLELGRALDARAVSEAWRRRIAYGRRLEACFAQADFLIAPVIPGRFAAETNLADSQADPAAAVAVRFTAPFNLTGSPSLTLPGGFDRDGAPVGIQLVGRHREEAPLLALGLGFQSATDWHRMHPSLGVDG